MDKKSNSNANPPGEDGRVKRVVPGDREGASRGSDIVNKSLAADRRRHAQASGKQRRREQGDR
jgi:hypothetical protein